MIKILITKKEMEKYYKQCNFLKYLQMVNYLQILIDK